MTQRKKYERPEMKAYQVKPASIICTSTSGEKYQLGNTDGWYTN